MMYYSLKISLYDRPQQVTIIFPARTRNQYSPINPTYLILQEEHRVMELQMAEADLEQKKIDAVRAKELSVLAVSRQQISTPGMFKSNTGAGSGETPKRTPMRLGL